MKHIAFFLLTTSTWLSAAESIDPARASNTVILSETGEANLGIEVVEVEEADFEETAFALGRVQVIPERRAAVASRIPGRVVDLKATLGEPVEAGAEVVKLESRQPGDPPPVITLTAPQGGLVTASNARLGEPVDPDKVLLEVTDLSEVHAVAQVPEHVAGRMKPGSLAHIKVLALAEEAFEGELIRFGTEADTASGTIDAVFKLPNPNLTLRPGMRAEFSMVLGRREGVTSVPRAALQGDAANRFVWVRDFELEHAFVKAPVVVGQTNDRAVEIVSGLLPGDSVVTRGAYSLAFAGGGSVSLKEALDAAHGHEHNADGSEMTADQKAVRDAAGTAHGHEEHGGGGDLLWKVISATLALMVVVQAILGVRKGSGDGTKAQPKPEAA